MQNATVCAAAYNGRIGRALRPLAHELMDQFSLNLVFHHPRTTRFHGAYVGIGRNGGRLAQHTDFMAALIQTHVMEDMVHGNEFLRCVDTAARLAAYLIDPAKHTLIEHGVITHGVINPLPVLQQSG